MSKQVSVAIPTFNRVSYLRECIQSVLGQTFQDFDIFVFDNASDEPVKEHLKQFSDSRIRFVGSEKNIGVGGNLNRIFEYPFESEYLVVFHDDDAMHPKMLEVEISFLDAHPDVVFVVSDLQRVLGKTILSFPDIDENSVKHILYKTSYDFARAQMRWLRSAFPSAMYRVNSIGDTRMKLDRFFQFSDMVFLMELSRKGQCAFLAAPFMNHRIHLEQYSEIEQKGYERGAMEIINFLRESLSARRRSDERLLRAYSLNSLLRACAHIKSGFLHSLKFLKKCRDQKLIRYRDFLYIDVRGLVSALSILIGSRKIIDAARWVQKKIA